jgi:hypothetical protein
VLLCQAIPKKETARRAPRRGHRVAQFGGLQKMADSQAGASASTPVEKEGGASTEVEGEESEAAADPANGCTTIFVKVERLRRLQKGTEAVHTVRRGEDGSFGLGLSEDNEIINFYHEENAGVLRIGDQVRAVNDTPLVRERLAVLLQRSFASHDTVQLHISRAHGEKLKQGQEAFAALQMRNEFGEEIEEWLSELWNVKTNSVWGTFWTVPIVEGAHSVWLGLHLSKMFTEPLIGSVEIPLADIPAEKLQTRWYSLRDEDDEEGGFTLSSNDIAGEILLTIRKFASTTSVSPDGHGHDDSSDDEPEGPIDHATEPLKPIADTGLPIRTTGVL